jgi:8-oxo-dGTP pyrophosphatase MutT (NUDIX family)
MVFPVNFLSAKIRCARFFSKTGMRSSSLGSQSIRRQNGQPDWHFVAVVSGSNRRYAEYIPWENHEKDGSSRKPRNRKVKRVLRVQYGALPYRFTPTAALEILLVTTRRSKRWIIPKGWPIKGLRPAKSAAREAFEEAGVRGKIGTKSVGLFNYGKLLEDDGIQVNCEVKVFPLLVKRQSETWPEFEQRLVRWVEPAKAISMIKEAELKKLVTMFAKRVAAAASKTIP